MIFFIYVVLLFLVLRFTVTLFNFLSNPKLGHYGKIFDDRVSILVEGNAYQDEELINVADYPKVEIIKLSSYDSIEKAVESSTGKYFLFVDGNLAVQKGLLNSMIYRTKLFNLALLSIVPDKKLRSFKERLIGPLPEYLLLNLLPLRLVRLFRLSGFSSANKQCLFFDADVYRQNNWHHQLKDRGWSKSKLSRLIKERGLNTEILLANKMLYNKRPINTISLPSDAIQQFDANLPGTLIYLILVMIGPLIMIFNFDYRLLVLPLSLILLGRVMISFLTRQNPLLSVVVHPLQMVALSYLLCKGLFMYFCKTKQLGKR